MAGINYQKSVVEGTVASSPVGLVIAISSLFSLLDDNYSIERSEREKDELKNEWQPSKQMTSY